MNKLYFTTFFLASTFVVGFTQGGWNLDYIPIDSVTIDWIGKEVRLDFKSSNYDVIYGKVSLFDIRKLLSRKDTIKLNIDGEDKEYTENWNIYVDQGFLKDQNLIGVENKFSIAEIFIETINESIITLKIQFYKREKSDFKKSTEFDTKIITIDKAKIKGVLFKREKN